MSAGPRSLDTPAETGAGIPDEAVGEGQLPPGALDQGADAAVAALQRKGWAKPAPTAEDEAEAHPS